MKRVLPIAAVFILAAAAHAQGCSQCRDNVSQTSPQQQRAYRQAIALMGGGALILFSAIFVVARKFR